MACLSYDRSPRSPCIGRCVPLPPAATQTIIQRPMAFLPCLRTSNCSAYQSRHIECQHCCPARLQVDHHLLANLAGLSSASCRPAPSRSSATGLTNGWAVFQLARDSPHVVAVLGEMAATRMHV